MSAPITRILVTFYCGRDYDSDVVFYNNADVQDLITALEPYLGGNYEFERDPGSERLILLARPSCMDSLRINLYQFLTVFPRREGDPQHWWFTVEAYLRIAPTG